MILAGFDLAWRELATLAKKLQPEVENDDHGERGDIRNLPLLKLHTK